MSHRCDKTPSDRRYCPLHGKKAKHGFYFRKSDSKKIERFRCHKCKKTTSEATGTACFGQNKRRVNHFLYKLLCSGVSQRRAALILDIDKKTVERKKKFLGVGSRAKQRVYLERLPPGSIRKVQFDEMETFEHTKLKPLSIAVAVNPENRKILGVRVSEMPAKGPNAARSRRKYGQRRDMRKQAMQELLKEVKPALAQNAVLTSDKKTSYPGWLREVNPNWNHVRVKGRRPCNVGMGELKEGVYDPLFCLNHTCAMIRDSVKRLARRNWCTTKKLENLQNHLDLYRDFHNEVLVA